MGMLRYPIRPLGVDIPKPVKRRDGPLITALLYGDTHVPFQDDRAVAIVRAIAADMAPDVIVHMGDLLDGYQLSRWDKDPNRKHTLQDEIDLARKHLASMRIASPDSVFYLLEGNHEDRLRRTLWNLEGNAAVLAKLTAFQKALTWPALLGTEELGVTFLPTDAQTKTQILPKMVLKHGTLVRSKSAYTASGEHAKYGKSGASGHTHRLAAYYHRDHNGNHVWLETGCTCDLEPSYMLDPDWQQGCVFITIEPKTGAFQAEPVYIHNGTAVFRGVHYKA